MHHNSPLRYPGGKARLTSFVADTMKMNGLLGGHYVEPYAGGGGVALNLLADGTAGHIHLNDLNNSIYAFWHCVLHQADELCKLIKKTRISVPEWHRQRVIQASAEKVSILELGFSTFYLNRTSRSGIIHKSGIIGGINQTGKWKINARFNKPELITRIKRIANQSHRISLTQMDAADFIREYVPTLPSQALIYFDPPYYVKGQDLYQNHYQSYDHELISELIQKIRKQKWLVSYDNCDEIKKLYRKRRQLVFALNYSAQQHYKGQEVFIFKDNLEFPDTENPVQWQAA